MIVGLPKEVKNNEHRVGLTPNSVKEITDNGHEVFIENNCGKEIGFTNEIYEIVSEVFSKDLKLVEGAKDYISKSDRNHYIGSNSNKDRILDGLKIVGLDKTFLSDQVYSFDMVQRPKPDPDIYLKVLNDNSLNREESVIIEDSGVGVKAATAAGVRVFGLTAGKHWHSDRDTNELFDNGALNVFSDYESLGKAIEEL